MSGWLSPASVLVLVALGGCGGPQVAAVPREAAGSGAQPTATPEPRPSVDVDAPGDDEMFLREREAEADRRAEQCATAARQDEAPGPSTEVLPHGSRSAFSRRSRGCVDRFRGRLSAAARVILRFEIEPNGCVRVLGAESTHGIEALDRCLRAALHGQALPPPEAGPVRVSYPVVIEPDEE